MEKKFDIILFGATGYTGSIVCEELVHYCAKISNITWAVAGRNDEKLVKILEEIANSTGYSFVRKIPRICASIEDAESLLEMARSTRIVINCVGPYALYGEGVVDACITGEAHHIDVSGESHYLELMQLKYSAKANDQGCFIIGACGFGSIAFESGVQYSIQKFPGEINEIEAFLKFTGSRIHYTSWESLVNSFKSYGQLSEIRKKIYRKSIPTPQHRQKSRGTLFYEPEISSWCIPLPSCDRSVVYRSQRHLYDTRQIRNVVQFSPYISVPNLFVALIVLTFGLIIGCFIRFKMTRSLLLRYPRLFTMGLVSHEGASKQDLKKGNFETVFISKGYDNLTVDKKAIPDKQCIIRLHGPEPGYITCAICVVEAAVTLLKEVHLMPHEGGVYSPGAAFWKTSLLDRLQERGLIFETVSNFEKHDDAIKKEA